MHPIAPYARTAYAQGWAASGGPMTDRVKAGCVAAVAHAIDHADEPGALETTLHLGHLEGTWAAIYQRRHRLHASAEKTLLTTWQEAAANVDFDAAAQQIGGLRPDGDATPQSSEADRVAQATAIIVLALAALTFGAAWGDLQQALGAALLQAHAEGWTAASMLTGNGTASLDDLASAGAAGDAANALGMVARSLGIAVQSVAGTIAKALLALTAGGATLAELAAVAERLLGDGKALLLAADTAVSAAYNAGMRASYAAGHITSVLFLTAGDGSECVTCDDLEAANPYPMTAAPSPPIHPNCRCVLAPA